MSSPQPPHPDNWQPVDPGQPPPAGTHPPHGDWQNPPPGTYPSPGQYQQPGQYQPAPSGRPAGRAKSRLGMILTIVGAVLLLAGVGVGVSVGRGVGELVPDPSQVTPVVGETYVTVEGGDLLVLYAPSTMMPSCDIMGPTEEVPDIDLAGASYSFPLDSVTYESVAKVGGPGQPEGEYLVDCEEEGLILAPPLDVSGMVGTVVGLFAAIGLGIVGFVLLVVGLIVWMLKRRG